MARRTVILKLLLLLAITVGLSSAGFRSLQYVCTANTSGTNLEFTVEGQLNKKQFAYYDSKSANMTLKTEWIKEVVNKTDNQEKLLQELKPDQQCIRNSLAKAVHNQTKRVQTVQWIYGCEVHDDGTEKRYWKYSYDGKDVLNLEMTSVNGTQAENTDQKWEDSCQKSFLMNECIDWLKGFVKKGGRSNGIIIGPVVAVLLLVLIGYVGVFI